MRSAAARLVGTVRAVAVLTVVELGIRWVPLPRLCRLLRLTLRADGEPGPRRGTPLPWHAAPGVRAAERLLGRWPWHDTCLRRSLLLADVLRGLSPVVRLGLRRQGDGVIGHAWLEIDGESLEDGLDDVLALQAPA